MSTFSRGYDAVRIGALGIVAIAAFIGLFLYVTNRALGMSSLDLYVRMPVAAGLAKGDPVLFRGVQVGEVKRITFTNDGQVLVLARLAEGLPLTEDTHAELIAVDMFGRQSVVLMDGQRAGTVLASRDTIPGLQGAAMTAQIAALGGRAERLMSDSMIALLQETLAGSAAATRQVAALSASVAGLIEAQRENVTALTGQAAAVARNLEIATAPEELVVVRGNLVQATAHLDSVAVQLVTVLGGLQRGEGSAGLLLHDDALYRRAESLMAGMEELMRDVKANPRKYINLEIF